MQLGKLLSGSGLEMFVDHSLTDEECFRLLIGRRVAAVVVARCQVTSDLC